MVSGFSSTPGITWCYTAASVMCGIVTLPHWEIRQFYPWVRPPPRYSGFVLVIASSSEYFGSPLL
eukprot:8342930-Pyramimonas_sp.AAC.1